VRGQRIVVCEGVCECVSERVCGELPEGVSEWRSGFALVQSHS
jgi:hypothetical protein